MENLLAFWKARETSSRDLRPYEGAVSSLFIELHPGTTLDIYQVNTLLYIVKHDEELVCLSSGPEERGSGAL
jgi:hypothetical protein